MSRSKIILRTITTILVIVVVLLAFSVSLIRIFGFEVYGVLTGSMEPKYPVGSLIYVKEINTDKLEVGDAISFKLSENVIATHRIVEIVASEVTPGAMSYRTKGDANDVVDSSLVEEADIIGKVVFCLPKMGYVLEYIQSPSGIVTTILVSLLLVALVFVSELITSDSELLWRIRCAITGESPNKTPNRRGATQQRRFPQYEDEPRRRSRYEDNPRPQQRSRAPRYEDDYAEPRRSSRSSSRYEDDYGSSRRSARDYDDGYSARRSASSSRYADDYSEPRRSGRSSSRYEDDYGSSRRSARDYDDGYSTRRSASSGRYEDYGETRRSSTAARASSSRSTSSRSYDDDGYTTRRSSARYSDTDYRSSTRMASRSSRSYDDDGYTTRRSRSGSSDNYR